MRHKWLKMLNILSGRPILSHLGGEKTQQKSPDGSGLYNFYFEVGLAELVKHFNEVLANHLRISSFDMVSLHKVYQLTIFEQRD